ncbi:MAG: hypothetical protein RJQ08_10675 [Salinisphaeraceae bacterium]
MSDFATLPCPVLPEDLADDFQELAVGEEWGCGNPQRLLGSSLLVGLDSGLVDADRIGMPDKRPSDQVRLLGEANRFVRGIAARANRRAREIVSASGIEWSDSADLAVGLHHGDECGSAIRIESGDGSIGQLQTLGSILELPVVERRLALHALSQLTLLGPVASIAIDDFGDEDDEYLICSRYGEAAELVESARKSGAEGVEDGWRLACEHHGIDMGDEGLADDFRKAWDFDPWDGLDASLGDVGHRHNLALYNRMVAWCRGQGHQSDGAFLATAIWRARRRLDREVGREGSMSLQMSGPGWRLHPIVLGESDMEAVDDWGQMVMQSGEDQECGLHLHMESGTDPAEIEALLVRACVQRQLLAAFASRWGG